VAPAYNGAPTGNVTFFDGNTSLGNTNLSGGIATFNTQGTALIAGSHSITGKYNGDSNFLTSTSAGFVQTVGPAATVTTLASNANPETVGKSVSFTAHVSSAVNGNLTGTVNFYLDGSTTPVAAVALSGGNAQYTTSSLSGGSHSLAAAFVSTNANSSGSTSTSLTQTIIDFTISATPASDTIARGSSGSYTLTLTPVGGLMGNVSLSCSGAPGSTTCSVSPGQVTVNGVNSAQASVTVIVGKHATLGTYTLTLIGTSGSVTHRNTVTLTIN
jgi:Big-like domain-containing protein